MTFKIQLIYEKENDRVAQLAEYWAGILPRWAGIFFSLDIVTPQTSLY